MRHVPQRRGGYRQTESVHGLRLHAAGCLCASAKAAMDPASDKTSTGCLGSADAGRRGIKLIRDVVAKESGPVDAAILWFIRDHVPAALNGPFAALTFSGSARVLVLFAGVAAIALLVARRRFVAVLIGALAITATLVVWSMKAVVGRARPAL